MPTNLQQPGSARFDRILRLWWARANRDVELTTQLRAGSQMPMRDWINQRESDTTWYYAIDSHTEEDFWQLIQLAELTFKIASVHVTTAMFISNNLDREILNDVEIPGIWLARVQKY